MDDNLGALAGFGIRLDVRESRVPPALQPSGGDVETTRRHGWGDRL